MQPGDKPPGSDGDAATTKAIAKAARRTARLEADLAKARNDVERRSARLGRAKARAWRLEAALADSGMGHDPGAIDGMSLAPASAPRVVARRAPRSQPHVAASADAGSNSVHLFVAIVSGHRLEPIYDEAAFLGLGAAVDAQGRLGSAKREQLTSTLARFAGIARDLGADSITFVATEPLRRANDARKAADEVRASTGVPLEILTHGEEALLTLIGVTHGREPQADLGVIDIGGGSSELVVIGPDGRARTHGVRLGSARLTASVLTQDPPTEAEVAALRETARRRVLALPDADIGRLVAVGGTATNVIRLVPAAALDRVLTRARLDAAMAALTAEPAAYVALHHAVNPLRARVLPAGVAILEAFLERYGLRRLRVLDTGIREGAVLAASRVGTSWRDDLDELARGWRTGAARR
jgi:exopolyphosphatase / guanosine-5'-triphosphate,3'-diphosphate pyrophosphatase